MLMYGRNQHNIINHAAEDSAELGAGLGAARAPRPQAGGHTLTFHFHALAKEMATHSIVLAWRIPGAVEPGGLPSMGSHRVGHPFSYRQAQEYFLLWWSLGHHSDTPEWMIGKAGSSSGETTVV